ncbi:MAG: CRISPR-associated RAMP protein Csx10 [Coleofasciculaceae cyanobacterium]
MKRIDLTITALSPLSIGRQKPGGSVSETENYIPGSVIRGAIAAQILQRYSQQEEYQQGEIDLRDNFSENGGEFQALFLGDNPAIFQNAYPAIAKIGKDESRFINNEVWVLPATAVSSKNESGFQSEGKNGVFDTLIDRFCAEAYNQPYDFNDSKSLADGTDARVEPYSGFYSQTNDNQTERKYFRHSVSTRFITRVGINRRRATAEDDILYSIEVLNESFLKNPKATFKNWEDAAYRSSIFIQNDSLSASLLQFINAKPDAFRLGGSASRGLGKVKIKAKDSDALTQVKSRINNFNQKLEKRWQEWKKTFGELTTNLLENRTYFTLDLQSDAVLTDNWQRTTVISPEMLQQFADLDAPVELHVAYASYDCISGWNSAWGLMKDVELVTNKGAVYLFSTTKYKESEWIEALKNLELKGVGDRTAEGFGQVQVCNEFHNVFREEAV